MATPVSKTLSSGTAATVWQVLQVDPSGTGNQEIIALAVAAASPSVNDDLTDSFGAGSQWYDTATGIQHICTSAADGAAVWVEQSVAFTAAGQVATRNAAGNLVVTNSQIYVDSDNGRLGFGMTPATNNTVESAWPIDALVGDGNRGLATDGNVQIKQQTADPGVVANNIVFYTKAVDLGNDGFATSLLHFDSDLSDSSATGVAGSAVGTAAISAAQSKFGGNSLILDGSSSVQLADNAVYEPQSQTGFTVDLQVRLDAIGTAQVLWAYTRNNNNWIECYVDAAGDVFFEWENGGVQQVLAQGPSQLTAATWHHVAVERRWTGATYEHNVYVDGAVGTTASDATDMNAVLNPNDAFQIGDQQVVTSNGFAGVTGYIDEFRINQTGRYAGAAFTAPTTSYHTTGIFARLPDGTIFEFGAAVKGVTSTGGGDLGYTAAASGGTVTNTTGSDAALTDADTTNAGLLVPADFDKLQFISVTAAVNLDNVLLDNVNETVNKTFRYASASWDTAFLPNIVAADAGIHVGTAPLTVGATLNIDDTNGADGMEVEIRCAADATGFIPTAGTNLTDSKNLLASLDTTSDNFWFVIIERQGGTWYVRSTGNF